MAKYNDRQLRHISEYRKRCADARAEACVQIKPIPTKPDDMTWRDYVIMLLHIGSELEHGLMVQYLYSAYSIGGDHLSEEDQELVQKWQDLILTVAREEMGHLLTVQNLLCLLGGPISFDREDFPWEGPFYPFAFSFEPLTRKSLASYVFAEMPGNFDTLEELYADASAGSADAHFRDVDIPLLEATVKGWVTEHAACPVGEVYQMVHDILADPGRIPDSDFRPETYPLQASWDDWGRGYRPDPTKPPGAMSNAGCKGAGGSREGGRKPDFSKANIIIEPIATRTDALYAIREIAGQGENPDLRRRVTQEPSHFERFVEVLEDFDAKLKQSEGWSPTRDVPINPTTVVPADPQHPPAGTTLITCEESARWADLFNCRYRMLLTYLTHTFRLARKVDPDEPNARGAVMHRVFGEMYNLKAIAGILLRMPLTCDPGDPRRAGPPFRVPYSLVLPPDETDCWRLHRNNVSSSMGLCDLLLDPAKDTASVAPAEGESYLRTLRNVDANTLAWMDSVLGGLKQNRGAHA
jgi:hypothetical protein